MPMQLSVIRRGDTLNPMVVNVNINMADVKGIKTQFHLRRTKILIKLKDRAIPDVEDKQENDAKRQTDQQT